jgi:hypothetical protein
MRCCGGEVCDCEEAQTARTGEVDTIPKEPKEGTLEEGPAGHSSDPVRLRRPRLEQPTSAGASCKDRAAFTHLDKRVHLDESKGQNAYLRLFF